MNNIQLSAINTMQAIQATMLKKSVDSTKTLADKVIGMADTNTEIMKNTSNKINRPKLSFKANIVDRLA
jgi:hypothetical protein